MNPWSCWKYRTRVTRIVVVSLIHVVLHNENSLWLKTTVIKETSACLMIASGVEEFEAGRQLSLSELLLVVIPRVLSSKHIQASLRLQRIQLLYSLSISLPAVFPSLHLDDLNLSHRPSCHRPSCHIRCNIIFCLCKTIQSVIQLRNSCFKLHFGKYR